jgi:hypothetical protein
MAQQQGLAYPTLADALWSPAAGSNAVRAIVLAVIGSILLTISAKIQVPFWPVPMTMQTFVVLVLGVAYGSRLGGATVLLYLVQGALGLPVFAGGGGFAYMAGPDGAIVEYLGNLPAERMNHVHFWQEQPFCAQLWYQKHLNAPPVPGRGPATPRTEANCQVERGPDRSWPSLTLEGTYRVPTAAVTFGDVMFTWYMRQDDAPLVGTRGQLYDHVALSVGDLDAWIAKLRGEGVTFLQESYRLGDTRAVMIEGPSREAIELVETR